MMMMILDHHQKGSKRIDDDPGIFDFFPSFSFLSLVEVVWTKVLTRNYSNMLKLFTISVAEPNNVV